MFATRVYHYRQPAAVILGLKELRKQGLTPRGLLFIALDSRGETYIVVPEDLDAVASIRVGDKLSLVPPLEGLYFHFDAVHRLPGDNVLWNGDRRLGDTGSAPEVACALSELLRVGIHGGRDRQEERGVIGVDENIPLEERALLKQWRIRFRFVGEEIGGELKVVQCTQWVEEERITTPAGKKAVIAGFCYPCFPTQGDRRLFNDYLPAVAGPGGLGALNAA